MELEGDLVLGRYRVLRELARTRSSVVYWGKDQYRDGPHSSVMIRHYASALGPQTSLTMAGLSERLSDLTHVRAPGIVSLLDYGQVEGRLAVVSSHRPGLPLSALGQCKLEENRVLSPTLAVALVQSLCRTLIEAKERYGARVLHGRISLDSIYVSEEELPQLMDFADRAIEDAASEAEAPASCLQTTISHVAPEIAKGEPLSEVGDVYALTLVLYRLLAGSNPFLGRSVPETLQRVIALVPARLSLDADEAAAKLNQILKLGLSKSVSERFQSVEQLASELEKTFPHSSEKCRSGLTEVLSNEPWGAWRTEFDDRVAMGTGENDTTREARRLAGAKLGVSVESGFPAFASGLFTEQPRSVSEHTEARIRQLRPARRRRNAVAVGTPVAALLLGLVLGRVEPGKGNADHGSPGAASSGGIGARDTEAFNSSAVGEMERLNLRIGACAAASPSAVGPTELRLQFYPSGTVQGVEVRPPEVAGTKLGACLVRAVKQTQVALPGATSLVLPIVVNSKQ